jgi:hypothetical protein
MPSTVSVLLVEAFSKGDILGKTYDSNSNSHDEFSEFSR